MLLWICSTGSSCKIWSLETDEDFHLFCLYAPVPKTTLIPGGLLKYFWKQKIRDHLPVSPYLLNFVTWVTCSISSFQSQRWAYCWSLRKQPLCLEQFSQGIAQDSPKKQVKLIWDHPHTLKTHHPTHLPITLLSSSGLLFQLLIGQQSLCSTKNSITQITSYLIVRGGETLAQDIERYRTGFGLLLISLVHSE